MILSHSLCVLIAYVFHNYLSKVNCKISAFSPVHIHIATDGVESTLLASLRSRDADVDDPVKNGCCAHLWTCHAILMPFSRCHRCPRRVILSLLFSQINRPPQIMSSDVFSFRLKFSCISIAMNTQLLYCVNSIIGAYYCYKNMLVLYFLNFIVKIALY